MPSLIVIGVIRGAPGERERGSEYGGGDPHGGRTPPAHGRFRPRQQPSRQ
jgi:hypothetical protein